MAYKMSIGSGPDTAAFRPDRSSCVGAAKSRRLYMRHKRYADSLVIVGILLFVVAACFGKDAKLQINVKPDRAYVYVDGTPFGAGSRKISVAPGKHSIGAYNYGFTP